METARRSRRRRLWWAAVLLALVASACGDDDGGERSASSSTRSDGAADDDGGATPDPIQLGERHEWGPGTLVGVHPGSPIGYVLAEDPASDELGCEGVPRPYLWAQAFDGSGERALAAEEVAGEVLPGGTDGQVAVVEQCEGFLVSLSTATTDPETGVLHDVRAVEVSGLPDGSELVPSTIRWSADGSSWTAVVQGIGTDGGDQEDKVVRITLDGAVVELVTARGVTNAVELADGTIVYSDAAGLHVGQEVLPTDGLVYELRRSPDGTRVAVFGEDGIDLLHRDGELETVYAGAASTGSWSPAGDALVFLAVSQTDEGASGDNRIVVVHLLGEDAAESPTGAARPLMEYEVADSAGFATPRFTSDGTTVAFSEAVLGEDEFLEPQVVTRSVR